MATSNPNKAAMNVCKFVQISKVEDKEISIKKMIRASVEDTTPVTKGRFFVLCTLPSKFLSK